MKISITDPLLLIHFKINYPLNTLIIHMQSDRAQSIVSDSLVFMGSITFDLFASDQDSLDIFV